MNMAVYGFACAFTFMMLALFLPEIIANYIYVFMVICSVAAIVGSIISVVWFIYELTSYAIKRKTHINDQNIIYSYGIKQPGSLFETVELKNENGNYYYVTLSMIDKWNGGGEKLPIPESFINNGQVDIEELLKYIAKKHSYMESMKSINEQKANTDNLKNAITLLTDYLKNKNYDIEFNSNEMTIVKHSDDPWNHFNKFIAKDDGVYNFIEVRMGTYNLTKRLSCSNYEIASFILLAIFFARVLLLEKDADANTQIILDSIKKHIDYALKNTSDYDRGQWFIDEILKIIK